ncbi:Sentrin-specific protease 1 [Stylophora pistillata]|uniref:Sentrin-specific protease 1 n=1 Tax=Stylophora pistillata TaxID=50429 RepID=A0A2B4R5F2_STYPI|nr:Sentrin-specific protease 1 [Stylophora pistillata]
MAEQRFYLPILPFSGIETASQSLPPYQVPEFWPLVCVLREVMYRFKSRLPENYDLPQVGKDRALDKQMELFIKTKWGDKNMKKVQQIARLSRRCFTEVQKIAQNPARYSRSERITSYTFKFLKASTSEEEAYDVLKKVADGEKVIADLNKEPSTRKQSSEEGVEELHYEPADLRSEVRRLQMNLNDEKKTTRELRKTLQSVILKLRTEVASLKKPMTMEDLPEYIAEQEPVRRAQKSPGDIQVSIVKPSKPLRSFKEDRQENSLKIAVKVNGKEENLLLEHVQSAKDNVGWRKVLLNEKNEQLNHEVADADLDFYEKRENLEPPEKRVKQEDSLEKSEWVAVFYPHKFYVGRIVEITKDDGPLIQFLDLRPGERFVLRSDTEIVSEKWIFCRKIEVSLIGKRQYSVANKATIQSLYDAFKKRHTLKEKVHSAWDLTKVKDISNSIAEVAGVKISFADFKTIDPRESVDADRMRRGWLNDQVINASFQIIQADALREGKRVFCTDTYLYEKLESLKGAASCESNVANLRKWIKKDKLQKSDLVLVPIHKNGNHWVLGVINMRAKKIHYYDSKNDDPMPFFFRKMRYLLSLHGDDVRGWSNTHSKSPHQVDSASCGVFIIEIAKRVVENRTLDFTQTGLDAGLDGKI